LAGRCEWHIGYLLLLLLLLLLLTAMLIVVLLMLVLTLMLMERSNFAALGLSCLFAFI
jgi:hypothetical protein